MNRCQFLSPSRALGLALFCSVGLWSVSAQAQEQGVREFPAAAKRATLAVIQPPEVLLNGNPERLAPGARIRGVNNVSVMSGALIGQTFIVNYLREPQGLIKEVWLLTEREVAEKRAGMEPVINYTFGSMADQPKTDDGKTPFNQLPKFSTKP